MRQDEFDKMWDKMSIIEKEAPNAAKKVAEAANLMTGYKNFNIGDLTKPVSDWFFAPKLEVARWNKILIQPAKVMSTYAKMAVGRDVPIADKVQAKMVTKIVAGQFAGYAGALLANQILLSASGSDKKINFFHPMSNDWLKFKVGDKDIDMSGGMISTMRFLGNIVLTSLGVDENKYNKGESKFTKLTNEFAQYASGKASPIAETIFQGVMGQDYFGRPMPWVSAKGTKGKPKYQWQEYVGENIAPIPFSETTKVIYDEMKLKGYDETTARRITSAFISFILAGGTGARITEDKKKKND
jgi:hypothetical protein